MNIYKIMYFLAAWCAELRLCTFLKDGESRAGLVLGEVVVDIAYAAAKHLGQRVPSDMLGLLDRWDDVLPVLRNIAERVDETRPSEGVHSLAAARLLAPIPRPRKIIATLVNTYGMLGGEDVEPLKHPRLFMKAPSTVIGPGETILAPPHGVRPEVELAAVIGRKVKRANVEEAGRAIIGYTIMNDVTAPRESREDAYEAYRRDPATGEVKKVRLRGPLFRSKNHDTFTPLGPWITTIDELGDVSGLRLTTRFNGETIQEGTTREYIFSPAEIAAFISGFMTLEPGDVVSAGTVGWVAARLGGSDPSEWVLPKNDGILELEIERIGVLRNPVKSEV